LSLLVVGSPGFAIAANLTRPLKVVPAAADPPARSNDHRTALLELSSITPAFRFKANLCGKDIATGVAKHRIRRFDQPNASRDREGVQNTRLARPVFTHKQRELRVQIEILLLELLEVLDVEAVNSHSLAYV
jgi:hypothetical protein